MLTWCVVHGDQRGGCRRYGCNTNKNLRRWLLTHDRHSDGDQCVVPLCWGGLASCMQWSMNKLEGKPLVKWKKKNKTSHTNILMPIGTVLSGSSGLVPLSFVDIGVAAGNLLEVVDLRIKNRNGWCGVKTCWCNHIAKFCKVPKHVTTATTHHLSQLPPPPFRQRQ